ncbi:MAG: NADP-dependent malic enzyme [Spirochaetota bacterium]
MDIQKKSLEMHKKWQGKIETVSKLKVNTREDLAIAYTPGVAEPCKKIHENYDDVYKYTIKGNTVAIVTDGTAVLGLGNIGPEAALPVMEGKAVLFKEFAGINAFPICLDTKDTDEIVRTIELIAPGFGGINLEDISAPRCFEIEKRLKEKLNIPVFHDDQHGTAIVVLAALLNSVKITGKKPNQCRILVNGAGAAGIAVSRLIMQAGFTDIILCDREGTVYKKAPWLNPAQREMAEITNMENINCPLEQAFKGIDIFIGTSAPGIVSVNMIKSMNKDAVVFAMANPVPEIMPALAKEGGARIIATGRSDYPNQVNNVLAFPGIFKGALEGRASQITEEMKIAAAKAIAEIIEEKDLSEENIIPQPFTTGLADKVAEAVKKCIR